MDKHCIYCTKAYQKNTEHVFPFGLGGGNIYMDCVCQECNNYFSGLERELYQKSPIAIMRSVEGVTGYTTNIDKRSLFKAPLLLSFDEKTKITYEVGQFNEMQIFIRPQVIYINEDFFIEGCTMDAMNKFSDKFKEWRQTNFKIILKPNKSKQQPLQFITLKNENGIFTTSYSDNKINSKDAITVDVIPETHELYSNLNPRLFINDDDKLIIRAQSNDQAISFICKLLEVISSGKLLRSFSDGQLDLPVINVGTSFHPLKTEQALVKIGINCLVHYFPSAKENTGLTNYINYVNKGNPKIITHLSENNLKIIAHLSEKDNLKDSVKDSHNVFFHQAETDLNIRLSLFEGKFVFNFKIQGLKILPYMEYNRLVINYKLHTNKFETKADFLSSFPRQ